MGTFLRLRLAHGAVKGTAEVKHALKVDTVENTITVEVMVEVTTKIPQIQREQVEPAAPADLALVELAEVVEVAMAISLLLPFPFSPSVLLNQHVVQLQVQVQQLMRPKVTHPTQ